MKISSYHSSHYKKLLDIILSLIFVPVVFFFFFFLWMAHFFTDKESVFFIDDRVGLHGDKFPVIKFRSIAVDELGNANPQIALSYIYKLMRRCHLDESPQIINVLRGEMSIIGPRPYVVAECDEIGESIPQFNARHKIKPGITGLAQMNYQHDNSEEVSIDKFQDDLKYIERANFRLDLKIIFRTITHIIRLRGI